MTADHLQLYQQARPRLLSLAYRMTGSVADSEDILQDAYLKFARIEVAKIGSAGALLTTIVTRLCLDLIRSARRQREEYFGPWLPEPIPDLYLAHEDPMQRETVSIAFILLLQRLPPVERAVYVLREIFDYDYAEIAKTVGKKADYCRQIFHRAKKSVRRGVSRPAETNSRERELLGAFLVACTGRDVQRLADLLGHDARMLSDGGGKASAAGIPVIGALKVAKFIFAVRDKGSKKEYYKASLNGQTAIVAYSGGTPYAITWVDFNNGTICDAYALRNPDKMQTLANKQDLLTKGVLVPMARYLRAIDSVKIVLYSLVRYLLPGRKRN